MGIRIFVNYRMLGETTASTYLGALVLANTLSSRSNVPESKSGQTSILRPLESTTCRAQAPRAIKRTEIVQGSRRRVICVSVFVFLLELNRHRLEAIRILREGE
jgi:hypothetical protein